MDPRLTLGAARFNEGDFFTAHEIWEEVWLESVGAEKDLLQSLVRIAAGYAKVESGIRGGALKLLSRGLDGLQNWLRIHPDVILQTFAAGVGDDLDRVRTCTDKEVTLATVRPPQLRIPAAG